MKLLINLLKVTCPKCRKGKIFESYIKLKPAEKCSNCGNDFAKYNVGDAPAYFSIFTMGILIPVLAIILEIYFEPAFWVHALIWIPATILFCYFTLIYVRCLFINLEEKVKNEK